MYLNHTQLGPLPASFSGKCLGLMRAGAILLEEPPTEFVGNLIAVVDNGPFAAAAYLNSVNEFNHFTNPQDQRIKMFLTWDKVALYAR